MRPTEKERRGGREGGTDRQTAEIAALNVKTSILMIITVPLQHVCRYEVCSR